MTYKTGVDREQTDGKLTIRRMILHDQSKLALVVFLSGNMTDLGKEKACTETVIAMATKKCVIRTKWIKVWLRKRDPFELIK